MSNGMEEEERLRKQDDEKDVKDVPEAEVKLFGFSESNISIESDQQLGDNADAPTKDSSLCHRVFPTGFVHELKMIAKLAWPLCLTQLLQFLFSSVAVAFCGHLGKVELDGASIAASMINVTGLTVMLGLSSGCDTIFSQTYGSLNKHKLGVALQRSFLILGLSLFPCWAIHVNGETLLLALHQDPRVSQIAGRYLLIFIPGLFFNCLYMCLSKYLHTQNIVIPNLIIGGISNVVNGLAHYLLVYSMEYGTDGSAAAQVLAYFTMFLLTALYVFISKIYRKTWEGWSVESFEDWGTFSRLSVFGMMMSMVEWLTFEIGIFMAGVLGTTELGAMSIVFQTCSLCYMVPFGVGVATSIRIGQFLGSGHPQHAKTTSRVGFVLIWMVSSVIAVSVLGCRHYIPRAFTNATDVLELAAKTLPAMATFIIFDGTNGVGYGIVRGMGRQQLGTVFTVLTYGLALATGIPAMLYSTMGIIGYWWCLAAAILIQSVILIIFIARTNWPQQVAKAQQRIKAEAAKAVETNGDVNSSEVAGEIAKTAEDKEKDDTSDDSAPAARGRLICCRVLIIVGFVAVLAVGIIIRLLLPPPHYTQPPYNATLEDGYFNTTLVLQTDFMNLTNPMYS